MDTFVYFIKKYRWLLIPAIPLVFFLGLTIFLLLPSPAENTVQVTPTPSPKQAQKEIEMIQPTLAVLYNEGYDVEIEDPLDKRSDFLKKEPADGEFPDGTIKHSFASTNPARPNIIITQGDQTILFQRNVTDPLYPVEISDYTSMDGDPEKIVQGSRFYGPDKEIYIYGSLGVAFIADPATQQVLEQHLFLPMNADEYIRRFGQ